MSKPHISVVIPAFNEASCIRASLEKVCSYLDGQGMAYEILVVDDGSVDDTVTIAEDTAASHPAIRVLKQPHNQGKGAAVRRGMLEAEGVYRLFSDADLSTPIEELRLLLPWLENGYDIAIGSRSLPDSDVRCHQPRYREMMGRIFNRLVRCLTVRGLIDTQCGFKCFRGDIVEDVFTRQTLDGFCFDVEVLYVAERRGYATREVPIVWYNSRDTKVSPLSDGIRMFRDLFLIAARHAGLSPANDRDTYS